MFMSKIFMYTLLKALLGILFLWMCYVVISTCRESNLFTEWNFLASIPWMRATLWDFYTNAFCIFLWICWKERSYTMKAIWLLLLVCLGSIATLAYLLIQLFRMKEGESLKEIIVKQHE